VQFSFRIDDMERVEKLLSSGRQSRDSQDESARAAGPGLSTSLLGIDASTPLRAPLAAAAARASVGHGVPVHPVTTPHFEIAAAMGGDGGGEPLDMSGVAGPARRPCANPNRMLIFRWLIVVLAVGRTHPGLFVASPVGLPPKPTHAPVAHASDADIAHLREVLTHTLSLASPVLRC
jgi:hypothetical protein